MCIYDLIQMSRKEIPTNSSHLVVAICFWSSSLNAFVFRSRIKTITLYDLITLFSLFPHGKEIDLTFDIDTSTYHSIIIKSRGYGPFMKSYHRRKDKVFDSKYVAFLLAQLSKFISCNCSKKVTKAYLSAAIALATKKDVFLGAFVLNHIYKGMNDLKTFEDGKLNGTTKGSIWMVHIQLVAYYSNIFNQKLVLQTPFRLLYRPLISTSSYTLKSFQALFSHFYEKHGEANNPCPFLLLTISP